MTEPIHQILVGISISESPDLERLGFGQEHLTELMISVARAVLRLDDDMGLVYGGDLRPEASSTRPLFDIALGERRTPSQQEPAPPRRIYNYLAWPYYLTLAKRDEAQMINACHFMRVLPRDAGFDDVPDDREELQQVTPPRALVASRCLTRMRELSTWGGHKTFEGEPAQPLQARIMMGGKQHGYSSLMPGLFEEFLISREPPKGKAPVPVFVIGALGGAAGQLAEALLAKSGEDPLNLDYQLAQEAEEGKNDLQKLIDIYAVHPDLPKPEPRYEALRAAIRSLRSAIESKATKSLDNGLTPAENRELLYSRDEVKIRQLLTKGLRELYCQRDVDEG